MKRIHFVLVLLAISSGIVLMHAAKRQSTITARQARQNRLSSATIARRQQTTSAARAQQTRATQATQPSLNMPQNMPQAPVLRPVQPSVPADTSLDSQDSQAPQPAAFPALPDRDADSDQLPSPSLEEARNALILIIGNVLTTIQQQPDKMAESLEMIKRDPDFKQFVDSAGLDPRRAQRLMRVVEIGSTLPSNVVAATLQYTLQALRGTPSAPSAAAQNPLVPSASAPPAQTKPLSWYQWTKQGLWNNKGKIALGAAGVAAAYFTGGLGSMFGYAASNIRYLWNPQAQIEEKIKEANPAVQELATYRFLKFEGDELAKQQIMAAQPWWMRIANVGQDLYGKYSAIAALVGMGLVAKQWIDQIMSQIPEETLDARLGIEPNNGK